MIEEILHHRECVLVRRQVLAPGESTKWHRDPRRRISVVLKGQALAIEFRDATPTVQVAVTPGQVDWSEPSDRVHRAVNIGATEYEEIAIFFLSAPDGDPQPEFPVAPFSGRDKTVTCAAAPT
jgi:quercetin dioxygenase-like cupin family protein